MKKRVTYSGLVLLSWIFSVSLCHALVPRFAYVVNAYDDTVSMYSIEAETGRLRPNGHVHVGRFPSSIVVHPSGKYVYVTEQTGHKVAAFKVDPLTGRLNKLPESPFDPKVVSPFWSTMDQQGKFLYIAGRNSNAITVMKVDPDTGALSAVEGAPFPGGFLPRSVAIHPSDRFVYMATINDDNISAYKTNQESGVLKEIEGSPIDAGDAPQFISMHPNGQYAFVTSWNSKEILSFKVDQQSGVLKKIQALKLDEGASPFGLDIHPSGRFVYVANWFGGTYGYEVDANTGRLTAMPNSPFRNFGDLPVQVIVDPSGRFAYVTNYESYHVTAYTIDPDSGELKAGETTTARAGPRAMAFLMGEKYPQRVDRFAYVANSVANTISAYSVNSRTGQLSPVTTVKTGLAPKSLAVDPLSRFVYVANSKSNSISAFEINQKTGTLTEIKGSPFRTGDHPVSILVDKIGKYVYVSNSKSNNLSVFEINPQNGFLTELHKTDLHYASPYPVAKQPGKIGLDPASRILYLLNTLENKISFFEYYETSPIVVESDFGSPIEFDDMPVAMAVEPNGKFAYVVTKNTKTLMAYEMNIRSGMLHKKGRSAKTGDNPVSIAIDASGRFIYVVNQGSASVSIYEVDTKSGLIKKKREEVHVGKNPKNITIDSSGKFAYVVSEGTNKVSIFNIENGALKPIGKVATGSGPVAMVLTSEFH